MSEATWIGRVPLCGAARRGDGKGQRCKLPAGWGTPTPGYGPCKKHGGLQPSHRKHAEKLQIHDAAQRHVSTLGVRRDIDPVQALTEELHRTAAFVAWLEARVGECDEKQLNTPEVQGVVALLRQERDQLVKVAKVCLDAGVSERRVALAEEQGRAIVAVMRAIFRDPDLNLNAHQREIAPLVAHRHLTALPSADEEPTEE